MTTSSNTDIQELKEFIKDGFDQLDKKIDNKFNELDKRIIKLESDLQGIDKRISNIESSVQKIPEITEKFGELKNWRQIAFIIIAAVVGWFARSGKM
jgi:wobble nucleotide-excising tRNase